MNVELLLAIAAIITAVGGLLGTVLASSKKLAVIETEVKGVKTELKEVKTRLDSHNGYAKMFSETSGDIASVKTDIAVIKTKLEYVAKQAN